MDLAYYTGLVVVVVVVLLAAYSFVGADVSSWGPDLTDQLPAYLIRESLEKTEKDDPGRRNWVWRPAVSGSSPSAPLLVKVLPTGLIRPDRKIKEEAKVPTAY